MGTFGDGVSIQDELALSNMTVDFDTLINVTLEFKVPFPLGCAFITMI